MHGINTTKDTVAAKT